MNARNLTLTAGLAILAVPLALSVTRAQSTQTAIQNPQVELFGGLTSSAVQLDANGNVLEASLTLPMTMIENAPKTMNMTGPMRADAVLEFPEVVRKTTFLNHAGIFWNPMGHEPTGRYAAPHWDFHFFGIPPQQAAAIDCTDLTLENPQAVAKGWLPPVPPNAPAKNFCVPLMGFHSEPLTEFKAPGQFKDGPFDKVMLGGYYAGQFSFIEPMVTTEVLLKKQSFSLPVPVPSSLGRATRFPTTFEAIFDANTNAYRLILALYGLQGLGTNSNANNDPSNARPRRRTLCTTPKNPRYNGKRSCDIPRCTRNHDLSNDQNPSSVFTCTSFTPSPSASRANSFAL